MTPEWRDAAVRGDAAALCAMADAGADVNARDRYGQTALMLAAARGHTEVVSLLVERRAQLDVAAKFGLSALMLAVVNGHGDIARVLAQAGADRSMRGSGAPGFAGKTAYDLAMASGRADLADELAVAPSETG